VESDPLKSVIMDLGILVAFLTELGLCSIMCKIRRFSMPTNLAIDDHLLNEALKIGEKNTKRETVNEALREYIQRRKRLRALEAFGTIAMDPAHDYKRMRRMR
jgi:Arc/MetJ family transcription regulator